MTLQGYQVETEKVTPQSASNFGSPRIGARYPVYLNSHLLSSLQLDSPAGGSAAGLAVGSTADGFAQVCSHL